MYEKMLSQAGLDEKEALVYETLLSLGQAGMKTILKKTPYKRGTAYNVVDSLVKQGLITERLVRGRKVFVVEDPERLLELLEHRRQTLNTVDKTIHTILPDLKSQYRLALHKPGVKFLEGPTGLQAALEDTLRSTEPICTYGDLESVVKYADDINRAYGKKRRALKITKRIIVKDTPFNRKYLIELGKDLTEIRFLNAEKYPFNSTMEIYNGKVSFLTVTADHILAVIVEDKDIAHLQKNLFEYIWSTLEPGLSAS